MISLIPYLITVVKNSDKLRDRRSCFYSWVNLDFEIFCVIGKDTIKKMAVKKNTSQVKIQLDSIKVE